MDKLEGEGNVPLSWKEDTVEDRLCELYPLVSFFIMYQVNDLFSFTRFDQIEMMNTNHKHNEHILLHRARLRSELSLLIPPT